MREFYASTKDREAEICCFLLTGLTKIAKAGVFSVFNHLIELTTQEDYACFLGCTQKEMERVYAEHIERCVEEMHITRAELLGRIKDYYNGFSFDGVHSVYNPYSLMHFFNERRFKNFWIDTGATSSLTSYMKIHDFRPENFLHKLYRESDMVSYEIAQAPPASYLVQTGYLTFKGKDENGDYILDYPNQEVRDSVSALLLSTVYDVDRDTESKASGQLAEALGNRDFNAMFAVFKEIFAAIPGKLYGKDESWYHTVLLTFLWGCSVRAKAEEWTANGISDIVIEWKPAKAKKFDVYIIELKKKPPETSLAQIHSKGYAEKYASAPHLALAGIEIGTRKKGLKSCKIEVIK
jgi:hypothetical protein